jgi:hypothetical protein
MSGVETLNLKPEDVIAVAVQEGDGSCLIVSHEGAGARSDFETAIRDAAEQAAGCPASDVHG